MAGWAEFFDQARRGGDEEFAEEVGENDVGFLELLRVAGVGLGEGDFTAPVVSGVFLCDAEADWIEVECFNGGGSEFFGGDGEDAGTGARVEGAPARGQGGGEIAKNPQAGGGGGVVAGAKGHACRNEDCGVWPRIGLPRGLIRVDA